MPAINTSKIRKFYSDNVKKVQDDPLKQNIYAVIGKSSLWSNESVPDNVVDSRVDRLNFYNDIIGGKKISSSDTTKVARRIDWTSGEIYDYYDDLDDLGFGLSKVNSSTPPRFYVITDTLDVYKCLDNNNGVASTTKPTGQLTTSFVTADGYRWKYMYTVTTAQKDNYMTPHWFPIQTLDVVDGSSQWATQVAAVDGSIEHIVVTDGGTTYNDSDPPVVTITGDGVGATATATINNASGEITNIVMTSVGSGYTNATVSITGTTGAGATARCVISPEGGHGSDAASELVGVFDMLIVRFIDDESGKIPVGISYRKVGLIVNPKSVESGFLYELTGVTGKFNDGENVTGPSGTGVCIKFLENENKMYFRVVTGTFTNTETITGDVSTATGVIDTQTVDNLPIMNNVFDSTEIQPDSGELLYMEHVVAINRVTAQVELIQFVLL